MKFKLITIGILALVLFTGCEELAKELSTTISGTVRDGSEPVEGAFVLAMQGLTVDGLASMEIDLSNGSITNSIGDYTIIEVDPGTYQILAVKDLNGNGMVDWDTDQVGIYGPSIGGIPTGFTSITIEEDEDIEGIDITSLYVWPL